MSHEESKLQQQCVTWFRAQYPQYAMLLTHPINEVMGATMIDYVISSVSETKIMDVFEHVSSKEQ